MSLINFPDSPSFTTDLRGHLQENSDLQDFLEHSDGRCLSISKIMRIMSRLERLTLPYCDSEGNSLQLWKFVLPNLLGQFRISKAKSLLSQQIRSVYYQ